MSNRDFGLLAPSFALSSNKTFAWFIFLDVLLWLLSYVCPYIGHRASIAKMLDRIGCTRFKAEFDHHEPCRFCFVVIIYSSFKSVVFLSFLAFSKVISIFGKGKFCLRSTRKNFRISVLLGLVTRDSFAIHLWSSNRVDVLAIKDQFPIKKQKQRPYTYVYVYIQYRTGNGGKSCTSMKGLCCLHLCTWLKWKNLGMGIRIGLNWTESETLKTHFIYIFFILSLVQFGLILKFERIQN